VVWFTSERYACVLENNPDIDEVVALPGDPRELDSQLERLRASRQWYRFYEPAPYRAYENVPGGDLTELLLSTYDGPMTVPLRPVVVLTDEEVQQARSWWAQLPSDRPRILVETEFYSQQSPWTVEYAREMIETLRPLRPVFVFTAKNRPPYLDELAADYPDLVWCDVPFRLNAELYNLCDAFIGVSSAISCLSNSTWCREDVPHIDVVSGPHWSTWHFRHHTRRRICFDRIKFKHALTWLADTLTGSQPSSSPVPNESLLALYTHRQEGKYHWLSPALLPSASSVASQQDALRAITRVLEDIGPFYLCYGGIGDFLLALSTALDQTNTNQEPITVVAYPNSVPAAKAFFDALPAVTNVYFIERHADPTDQYIAGMFLRAAAWSLPNCRGRGVTPPAREDDFWKPGLDIVRSCGVTLYPKWVRRYVSERLEQPQVVLAPMGSVYGMFRSKRNIIAPQYWDALLALLRASGIRPIVIGTPDEADAYPIDQGARDERSYCFEDQFRILASADLVIAADSWHKTFAAMAGVPTIVFEPLKNHDLAFWFDSSHAAFIHPWKNIQLVRSWNEARRAIIDALESHCGIKLGSPTIHVRNPIEHPRRTNPEQPLTSLHPVFWERPYQQAHNVLIRLPDAVGDTLMMTAVTSALVSAYPHLELTIAGAPFATDIFRHHPNIRQCVRTHSSSDLRAEASADVVVDYRYVIDQLPEYYGILPMMDVLANIAGIRLPSKQIVYHIEQDELDWAAALVPQEYPVLALHLSTAKDPYRSYPHGSELLSALLEHMPDVQLLWLGSTPAPLRNERIIDCARREYSLRQQIALVGRASAAVVIDSAFYHVAHNRWQKPTLLLAGPTSEYLIGNYASAPLFTLRSSMCSACYWNAERCKRTCLASLDPRMVARAAAQFFDRVCRKSLRPLPLPKRTLLRCSWDRLQRQYAAACMHHRTGGNGPVEIVITPGDPLPDYASQWNGITIDEHTHKSAVSLSEVFHS
jgi:ADP-heptose:LPS heptosyltransferase